MKSPLLKLPALILAALMMMSLVACAVINPNGSGTTDPNGGANVESGDDQNYVCDLPDDLNYNNEEVNIMFVKVAGRDDELISEELGHGVIPDAVYDRLERELGRNE